LAIMVGMSSPPMAAASAIADPETAAKNMHATTATMASPEVKWPTNA